MNFTFNDDAELQSRNKSAGRMIYPAVILALLAIAYIYVFDEKVQFIGDNLHYYLLGKALAEDKGYVMLQTKGLVPATHFPPGYPFIVSIVLRLFPASMIAVKIFNGVLLAGCLLILHRIFIRVSRNEMLAFAAALLLVMNGHLLNYSGIEMSEIPFLLFTLLALLCALKIDLHKPLLKDKYFWLLLLVTCASYYIRAQGAAVLAAVIFVLVIHKKFIPAAVFATGFFAAIIPWHLRNIHLKGGSYIDFLMLSNPYRPHEGTMQAGDWLPRISENSVRYLGKEIPGGVFSFLEMDYNDESSLHWPLALGIAMLLLTCYGLYKVQNKTLRSYLFAYLGATLAILLAWPKQWYGVRFLLPVIPFIVFLSLYGSYLLASSIMQKYKVKASSLVMLVIPLALSPFYIQGMNAMKEKSLEDHSVWYNNYIDAARWAKENIPEGSVVCCRKTEIFYIYAERPAVNYKYTSDAAELVEELVRDSVDYVVVDDLGFFTTKEYLVPAIEKYPEKFTLIYQPAYSETYVYKFER